MADSRITETEEEVRHRAIKRLVVAGVLVAGAVGALLFIDREKSREPTATKVFSDPGNAIALKNRLVKAGIPAHTETRVQVGPFKDRQEAESAARKMKAMGLAPVIAPR